MLWIGREVGQGFYIDRHRYELKRASMNHAILKGEDGREYNLAVTGDVMLNGCRVILTATRNNHADFHFDAPDRGPDRVEIYRDELYGKFKRD